MFCQNIWRGAILLCLAPFALPPEVASEDNEEDSLVVSSGNVTLAFMARINEVQGDHCGDFNPYSLQGLLAVVWFLDAVNEKDYVPGITIGLEAYRTCRLPSKAAKGAMELIHRNGVGRDPQTDPLLFGILGPDATAEATVVSSLIGYLPANQQLLQISGSATGKELSNKTLHPNFFRVVISDYVQIKVMQKMLQELDWNYIAIVYDDDEYGRSAATKLKKILQDKDLCVPVFVKLPLDTRSLLFRSQADSIADMLNSQDNGPIRGIVIVASDSTTRQLIHILDSWVRFPQLILSEAVGLNTATLQASNGHLHPLAAGALLTAPPYIPAPEFDEFWSNLWTNRTLFSLYADRLPWLGAYFVQLTGCSWSSADCWARVTVSKLRESQTMRGEAQKNLFVGYTIKAAAVMVELLKRLQQEKCGDTHSGVCEALSSSIEARVDIQSFLQDPATSLNLAGLLSVFGAFASETSVRFNSNGDVVLDKNQNDVEYMVYNLIKGTGDEFYFKQVGEYGWFKLEIDEDQTEFYDEEDQPLTWEELPQAQCDDNHDCLLCKHDVSGDVMFMEGDFYVLALVAVHERSWDSPLKCGEVRKAAGADVAQGVMMAVNDINSKNFLPGSRVGLIVINSCNSPLYIRQILTDFYTGTLPLPDGRNSSHLQGRVMGVVGAHGSDSTVAAYDTLSRLLPAFVQVSGSATATELKDRRKYPYFMRLVPADDCQARVMLDIVHSLGAHYIQLIYDSSTTYGSGILQRLQEETSSHRYNICIAQSIAITPSPQTTHYQYIANKLREKSDAHIILTLLPDAEIDQVLTAILPLLTSQDSFRFLGSESWGSREALVRHRPQLAGSLVLVPGVKPDPAFQRYFTHLNLARTPNPWLPDFLGCFGDKSFRRKGREPCPRSLVAGDEEEVEYEQDAAVPLSIRSTYALVQGFHAALVQYCGKTNVSSICEDLTSRRLVSAMRGVELDVQGDGRVSPVFDGNGDGLLGYTVLQVVVVAGQGEPSEEEGVAYAEVGTWTSTSGLSLRRDELIPLTQEPLCPPGSVDCHQCQPEPETPTSPPSTESDRAQGVPVPVAAGVGSFLIIVIIVLVIVLLVCWTRRRGRKENHPRQAMPGLDLQSPLRRNPDATDRRPPSSSTTDISTSQRYTPPPFPPISGLPPLPRPRPPPSTPQLCDLYYNDGYLQPTPPTTPLSCAHHLSTTPEEPTYLKITETEMIGDV